MELIVPATFTGTGAKLKLSAIPGAPKLCRWWQLIGVSASGSRVGDVNVSSSQGVPVGVSTGQFSPPVSIGTELYDLDLIYAFVGNGDTVILACAV